MTIHIYGGSNSLLKNGWAKYFTESISEPVLNRSIGATTTLMALYRALDISDMQPGDLVIWEYALNDFSHISRDYRLDAVLRNLELFIVLCRKRKCRLVAAIFTPIEEERAPERHPYYARLTEMLSHYGVSYFDVSAVYRALSNGIAMTPDYYFEPLHYALDAYVMEFISDGVTGLCDGATCPADAASLYIDGREPVLVTDFCTARFKNSIVDLPAARLPLSIGNLPFGEVIGLFCMTDPIGETGVRCGLDHQRGAGEWFRFSTTVVDRYDKMVTGGKPTLKAVSVEHATRSPWIVGPGDVLTIAPALGRGEYYAEALVQRSLLKPKLASDVLITGILLAVQAKS